MEARLTEFLLSIGEEPKKLAVWQENPDSLLDATNLTPAEKAIIKSGNSAMLDRAIAEELYQYPDLLAEAFITIPPLKLWLTSPPEV
ncbi:hypothetical protein H6S82_09030 [Planktothrix sp. FACHB-1355]|uniref:Uncharacterized protein n=1 Tax=Aerosakkonema funiforme FACHB-1375 TaxID=2949571 RepID=A0A926VCT9_9CYAN|nr:MULTISPECIES: hypothetical protein [Oscillatoriales]MBD2181185.1 hypothetical protein [Aerosakkonema funiforme FACHB-1375]MBD3558999.1 hypothetical protein [Planktothrix sp. FACHB-1355]